VGHNSRHILRLLPAHFMMAILVLLTTECYVPKRRGIQWHETEFHKNQSIGFQRMNLTLYYLTSLSTLACKNHLLHKILKRRKKCEEKINICCKKQKIPDYWPVSLTLCCSNKSYIKSFNSPVHQYSILWKLFMILLVTQRSNSQYI
jgi:hypothetical protein